MDMISRISGKYHFSQINIVFLFYILSTPKTVVKAPEIWYTSGVLSSITDIYYPFAYKHYSICKSGNQYSSAFCNSFLLLRRNSILLQIFLQ